MSLPEALALRFLAAVTSRRRSASVARLIETELARRDAEIERSCLSANADRALAGEIEEWQAFEDNPAAEL